LNAVHAVVWVADFPDAPVLFAQLDAAAWPLPPAPPLPAFAEMSEPPVTVMLLLQAKSATLEPPPVAPSPFAPPGPPQPFVPPVLQTWRLSLQWGSGVVANEQPPLGTHEPEPPAVPLSPLAPAVPSPPLAGTYPALVYCGVPGVPLVTVVPGAFPFPAAHGGVGPVGAVATPPAAPAPALPAWITSFTRERDDELVTIAPKELADAVAWRSGATSWKPSMRVALEIESARSAGLLGELTTAWELPTVQPLAHAKYPNIETPFDAVTASA
jgi:hypothetical protein